VKRKNAPLVDFFFGLQRKKWTLACLNICVVRPWLSCLRLLF
jgi:hypothetical protein